MPTPQPQNKSQSFGFKRLATLISGDDLLQNFNKKSGLGFGPGKPSFSQTMGKTGKYREILGNTGKYRRKLGIGFVTWYRYKLMVITDVLHAFCFFCQNS